MATTGIVYAGDIMVYDGDTAIAHQTNCELSGVTDMYETSSKNAGKAKGFKPGKRSFTCSVSGMVAWDATKGYSTLLAAKLAGTALTVKISTEVAGDKYLTGSAYVQNLGIAAQDGDKTTFDCSFQVDGDISEATVPAA